MKAINLHTDTFERFYVSTKRIRTMNLIAATLSCFWVLASGYLWLVQQASWLTFLAAVMIAACICLNLYSIFTSRLVLSADGILFVVHGAEYFTHWEGVWFNRKGNWRRPADSLIPFQPITPRQKTVFGRWIGVRPLAFIPLRVFGWPCDLLQEDIERYAPQLLEHR